MAAKQPLWTLIGDLVGSKDSADRPELQRSLDSVLTAINVLLEPSQPLESTVGDEFQGGFSSMAHAVRASLLLRLELFGQGGVDSRYGLGHGTIAFFDANSKVQDGPGWWSARTAIDRAKRLAASPRTSFARTCFSSWETPGVKESGRPAEASSLNAFLLSRDAIVGQMQARSRRILLGLLLGYSQTELAEEERVTQSAISQNLTRSGAFAVEAAQRCFEEQIG
jgi:SatD family (SatD)